MSLQTRKCRTNTPESAPLIPVSQYVRMSDEAQQYSLENQKTAIQEYAARHGFLIVKTYADAGKSGVIVKNRPALRDLQLIATAVISPCLVTQCGVANVCIESGPREGPLKR
jgi:hypothetical protein